MQYGLLNPSTRPRVDQPVRIRCKPGYEFAKQDQNRLDVTMKCLQKIIKGERQAVYNRDVPLCGQFWFILVDDVFGLVNRLTDDSRSR